MEPVTKVGPLTPQQVERLAEAFKERAKMCEREANYAAAHGAIYCAGVQDGGASAWNEAATVLRDMAYGGTMAVDMLPDKARA